MGKTIELGLGFLKFGKTIGWEMGFGQNLGSENGIYTSPSGPSKCNAGLNPGASVVRLVSSPG